MDLINCRILHLPISNFWQKIATNTLANTKIVVKDFLLEYCDKAELFYDSITHQEAIPHILVAVSEERPNVSDTVYSKQHNEIGVVMGVEDGFFIVNVEGTYTAIHERMLRKVQGRSAELNNDVIPLIPNPNVKAYVNSQGRMSVVQIIKSLTVNKQLVIRDESVLV